MKVMDKVLNISRVALMFIAALMLIGMSVLTILQIVLRYFESPLAWAEEATRMGMIWLTFSGAAAMWASREHITITALIDVVPERLRGILLLVVDVIVFVLSLFLIWYGFKVSVSGMNTMTTAMGIPWGYAYSVVPFSFFFVALFSGVFIIQGASKIRQYAIDHKTGTA